MEDGFGSLARGLFATLLKTDAPPTRLAVGVLALTGNPTTLGVPLPGVEPTFFTWGLAPRLVPGRSWWGRRGLLRETFGVDIVDLTENKTCSSLTGPVGVTGVRGQCEKKRG